MLLLRLYQPNQTENEETLYKLRILLDIFKIRYANFPKKKDGEECARLKTSVQINDRPDT